MNQVIPIDKHKSLSERFWGIVRGMELAGLAADRMSPVSVVRHVLAVLDALDRGETGTDLSVNTLSFLNLLRDSEQRGDLSYASPEQIRGEMLDERSLVFSVGVLLFERLTGRHPFGAEGNAPRRIARIRKGELGSGVNYFPTVPGGLRTVLMRAMGPFPEERFATLAELRTRLDQFVSDHQSAVPRLPGTTRGKRVQGTSSPRGDATKVVQRPDEFARDLMAAYDVHAGHVKHRRRKQRGHADAAPVIEFKPVRRPEPEEAPTLKFQPTPEPQEPRAFDDDAPTEAWVVGQSDDRGLAALADASPQAVPVIPQQAIVTEPVSLPLTADQPRSPLWGRIAWLGAGAALATAALLILMPRVQQASSAAPAAGSLTAHVAAEPAAAQEPEIEPAAIEPAASVFDPSLGATTVADAVRPCFSESERAVGVRFRIGVRYSASDRGASKVYFSNTDGLTNAHRACVRTHIDGTLAGAAPPRTTVINYRVRVRADGSQATPLL